METLTKIGEALLTSAIGILLGAALAWAYITGVEAMCEYADKKTDNKFKQYLIIYIPQVILFWAGLSVYAILK